ncbi:class I SAM-dependent methyltransferase [Phototrophicus methaneseepsis]|uniref:Class I SAM-dependent methyltransferase n=1 Tax=Phototrophicus methaneseepsis TaxID=2710758 RepID=A0A7S8E6J0_9CHLR|nr:class I SAM-dependent methyltransferase [Phototrophicus methaneseepsis]QPC81288.1 class I SAM-dependent methyltransferase [Phototrophicus methaneseepsis]
MFTALLNRRTICPEWQKIPWHEADFSRRMLAEHLNQMHDLASRRFSVIDQHVHWIHRKVLKSQAANVLDLGCGPGFYTGRLAALGHTCVGVDISPASIAYAREHNPGAEYILNDVRLVDYAKNQDLILMIYGELNAFSPQDAKTIIKKAYAALKPGGKLLLEVHTAEATQRFGKEPATWHTAQSGLFSDEPYLCLMETTYEADHTVFNYYVYAADSGEMTRYTSMLHTYTDDEYRQLLQDFSHVLFYPSLTGIIETSDLFVIVAEK